VPADVRTATRTIRITLKLYASLTAFLPESNRKHHSIELQIPADATLDEVVTPFGMPKAQVFLVLVNGVFIPPSARAGHRFKDGDALAIWPPVAGG
jgi:sulfur carrier protein ThiS